MLARRTLAAASLALAAFPFAGAPAARADEVDDAITTFKERMKGGDTQAKKNAIAEVALKKDTRVAEAFKGFFKDKDVEVRIALAQSMGEQKDPKVAVFLESQFEMEEKKKDREQNRNFMGACVEGIGEADAKGHFKFLEDALRTYLDKTELVAGAAAKAIAHYPSNDSVDILVRTLGVSDSSTVQDSAQKRAARAGTKPVIIDSLQKLTGKEIKEVKVWKDWWDENKKTWKPAGGGSGAKDVDINASDTYKDDAYKFEVKKPNAAWSFKKGSDNTVLRIEAIDDGQQAAWVNVIIYQADRLASKTPDAMSEESRKGLEGQMKDVKAEKTEWSRKTRFVGEGAVEQLVFGRHKDWDACQIHKVFVVHDGLMFIIDGVYKSGKKASLADDVEKIVKGETWKWIGK